MARPKGSKNNVDDVKEVKKEVVSEAVNEEIKEVNNRYKEEEALRNQAILADNDSEKIRKDVMLKNCDELDKHMIHLNARIKELTMEYESRRKLVDNVNSSIGGAQTELFNLKTEFEKRNTSLMAEVNKKQAEIEAADKTLRALMTENQNTKKANDIETSKLAEHRNICNSQVYEMKKALDQNQSEWNKREADILRREEELKVEKEKFEAEKDALTPEMARITSIKNENILLLQKIEADRIGIENIRKGNQGDKDRLEESKIAGEAKIKRLELNLANEEARLRKWEQDLKDYELEVRAKSAQADKIVRREQLQKEVDSVKK